MNPKLIARWDAIVEALEKVAKSAAPDERITMTTGEALRLIDYLTFLRERLDQLEGAREK